MTRQEAIQTLSKVGKISVSYAEDLYDSFFPKPVVPQFVADWYEEHKERLDYELWEYLVSWDNQSPDRFKEWFNTDYEATLTLVNMHQFGYEVEKEKRYLVKMKGIAKISAYLNLDNDDNRWYWCDNDNFISSRTHHTRKELEDAGFGWIFSCEGIEVEEVE